MKRITCCLPTWAPALGNVAARADLDLCSLPFILIKSLRRFWHLPTWSSPLATCPSKRFRPSAKRLGRKPPKVPSVKLKPGEAIAWYRQPETEPVRFRSIPPQTEHQRHIRKYAEGKLSDDDAFYFRGPEGKLKLRAQNLMIFIQLAEGVDDETWLLSFTTRRLFRLVS